MIYCCICVSSPELLHPLLVSHFLGFLGFEQLVPLEGQLGIYILLLLLQGDHAVGFFYLALSPDLGLSNTSACLLQ